MFGCGYTNAECVGCKMGRVRGLLLICCLMLTAFAMPGVACASTPPAAQALAVRIAAHDDGITRFVLELSENVSFTVAVVEGRVILDLPALDWRASAGALARPVGLISSFAYGTTSAGGGRITLQTSVQAVVQKAFLIPPAAHEAVRLVVDLVTASPAQIQALQRNENPLTGHGGPIVDPPAAAATGPVPKLQLKPEPAVASLEAVPDRHPERARKPVVVIDPGHGGVDPGTIGLSGEYEKNIVLALALAVKEKLDRDGKVKCVLTRDRDIFIPLPERVSIARDNGADLFMSLHADSEADPNIRGLSVYTLSRTASDAEAQALADKENKADIVAGVDLAQQSPEVSNILIDLVQRESLNSSAAFASLIIDEVGRETHILLQNTHRFAGFAVLKAPDVPSVLVETGYLSNRDDEQLLRRPEYRVKLAAALAAAVERYFDRTHGGKRP